MEMEFIDGDPTKGLQPVEHKNPFNIAPKDCDIPTTHQVDDDIILEEK